MFEIERLQQIQKILNQNKTASVSELSAKLYVSEATVRRDLNELQQQGLVKRIHGGVVLIEGTNREVPLYVRERQNHNAKVEIASRAASYLQDGQVLFLDASSTVQHLVKHLESYKDLTILTNGLKTAQELSSLPHKIYCTGGLLLRNSSAYVGSYAERIVHEFNADLLFFSSRGVSEDGRITDDSAEETLLRRAMFEQSKKRIYLCDSSKFGLLFCYNLCTIRQVDAIISNQTLPFLT